MKRNDQNFYEEYAASSWQDPPRFARMLANQVHCRLEYFDRVDDDWDNLDVLDLGCGCGFMSEALARRGARVIGVDPCEAALDAARKHARSIGLAITYERGIGEAIPLETESVDRVVCVDVLEHVEDVRKVIGEVFRVLRPDGLFFFDTINRNRIARFMVVTLTEDVLQMIPRGAHDPSKFIRPDELCKYLQESGFTCPQEFVGMGPVRLDRRRDPVFGLKRSTRVMYVGYARKLIPAKESA